MPGTSSPDTQPTTTPREATARPCRRHGRESHRHDRPACRASGCCCFPARSAGDRHRYQAASIQLSLLQVTKLLCWPADSRTHGGRKQILATSSGRTAAGAMVRGARSPSKPKQGKQDGALCVPGMTIVLPPKFLCQSGRTAGTRGLPSRCCFATCLNRRCNGSAAPKRLADKRHV